MTASAIFIPLVAAWALLAVAARRPGWGYVGDPLPRAVVEGREMMRALREGFAALLEVVLPALEALGVAAREANQKMMAWDQSRS